jgi:hypothetical protein
MAIFGIAALVLYLPFKIDHGVTGLSCLKVAVIVASRTVYLYFSRDMFIEARLVRSEILTQHFSGKHVASMLNAMCPSR